jgi:hypothetical protein
MLIPALLLFGCLTHVNSLNRSSVHFGTLLTPRGNARTYIDWHEVVIVREHPRVIHGMLFQSFYGGCLDLLGRLKSSAPTPRDRMESAMLETYEHRFARLGGLPPAQA